MRVRTSSLAHCVLLVGVLFVLSGCGFIAGSLGGPELYPNDREYYTFSWDINDTSLPPKPYISGLDIKTTYFNGPTIITGFRVETVKSATFEIHGLSQEKLVLLEQILRSHESTILSLDRNFCSRGKEPAKPYILVNIGGNHIRAEDLPGILDQITQKFNISFDPASQETYKSYKKMLE